MLLGKYIAIFHCVMFSLIDQTYYVPVQFIYSADHFWPTDTFKCHFRQRSRSVFPHSAPNAVALQSWRMLPTYVLPKSICVLLFVPHIAGSLADFGLIVSIKKFQLLFN